MTSCIFEGDLILIYDQEHDKLGVGKLKPLWHGPYVVKLALQEGSYQLVEYDGIPLKILRMGSIIKGTMLRDMLHCPFVYYRTIVLVRFGVVYFSFT